MTLTFKLRRSVSTLAVAMLGLSGPAAAQDVTLQFANWASAEPTTQVGIEQVIEAFEAENPGITIESQTIAFSEMARQLVLRLRSGNPPDVAQLSGNETFVLAASGGLEPAWQLCAGRTCSTV